MPNSLDFIDFSGGITDNYLDAPLNRSEKLDNFFIKGNKKLETVPGTVIYDDTMYQIPAGNSRIGSFPKLSNDVVFSQNARNLYYQTTSWQTLLGPTSNSPLAAGTTSSYASFAEWNGHLLITTDAFGSPMKIYRDSSSTIRVRNAGLPKVTLTAMISLANDLKSKFNAHIADATEHTAGVDSAHTVSTADSYDFPTLAALTVALTTAYDAHEGDAELASAWSYHAAQEASDHSLTSLTTPITLSDVKTRLDDLKSKFNAHDADGTAHGTDTLHQTSKYSEPQISGGTTASSQYIYYFVARFNYTVGDVDFIDRGPTHFITLATLTPPNSSTVSISDIPVIANGSTENYDTSTIVWEIYRTEQNLSTPKYIGEVTNGTTTYSDTASDASITNNSVIYTDGGVKDNDPPPQAKYVVVVDDIAWYGHVKEGGQVRKSRLRQAVKFDIDSCPEGSYIDLEDEIVGLGAIGVYPVAFCKNHIYRIEGFKDEFGRGVIAKREISRGVGGVNHLSIVNTYKGIFFCGSTGWYWTDGFQVKKVTTELDATYASLTNTAAKKARIYGVHDAVKDRVYWAMQSSGSSTDNDSFFVLDINFPFDNGDGRFTTITPDSDSWNACAVTFDTNEVLTIGDSRGYLFKFDDGSFTNPKIDTSALPSAWQTTPIVWDYRGPGINMGDANNRKAATHITVVAENITPLSLVAKRKTEDSGYFKEMAEIRSRNNIIWGDPTGPVWKPTLDGFPWKTFPLIIERRRFVRDGIRFLYMQIQLTNSETIIYRSDDYGVATVAALTSTTRTATTDGTLDLPDDLVDYYITFEADSYTQTYLITAVSGNVITYVDVAGDSATGASKKWQIVGVRKNERLNLNSYSIEWEMLTSSHNQYRQVTGGNE